MVIMIGAEVGTIVTTTRASNSNVRHASERLSASEQTNASVRHVPNARAS